MECRRGGPESVGSQGRLPHTRPPRGEALAGRGCTCLGSRWCADAPPAGSRRRLAARCRARCVDRLRGADAGNGRWPRNRPWRAGLVRRHLADDDGGDDAAVGRPRRCSCSRAFALEGTPGRSSSATCSRGRATALIAYALYRAVRALAPSFVAWDEHGPWVAGGALVGSGRLPADAAQATPACATAASPLRLPAPQRPCRSARARCAWELAPRCDTASAAAPGLMLALFALGVMSLVWMAVVAGGDPRSRRRCRAARRSRELVAITLVAVGIWIGGLAGERTGTGGPGQDGRWTDGHGAVAGELADHAVGTSSRATATRSARAADIDGVPGGRSRHGDMHGRPRRG